MLIDSHAHLDSPGLFSDLAGVMDRAEQAGIDAILTVACANNDPESVAGVLRIVDKHDHVFASLGVHPHDARLWNQDLERAVLSWVQHPKVLAWGEIGLDYFYDNSPKQAQIEVFQRQLVLARECQKPVIIHSRDAGEETCSIIEEVFCGEDSPGGVMHCFTYGKALAVRSLDLGFYLGFGGIVTFPRSEELREVAALVPDDRFLIETDSPYLAPVPHRGRQNEPAFVKEVARTLAELRETDLAEIGRLSSKNFSRLFGLDQSEDPDSCFVGR